VQLCLAFLFQLFSLDFVCAVSYAGGDSKYNPVEMGHTAVQRALNGPPIPRGDGDIGLWKATEELVSRVKIPGVQFSGKDVDVTLWKEHAFDSLMPPEIDAYLNCTAQDRQDKLTQVVSIGTELQKLVKMLKLPNPPKMTVKSLLDLMQAPNHGGSSKTRFMLSRCGNDECCHCGEEMCGSSLPLLRNGEFPSPVPDGTTGHYKSLLDLLVFTSALENQQENNELYNHQPSFLVTKAIQNMDHA